MIGICGTEKAIWALIRGELRAWIGVKLSQPFSRNGGEKNGSSGPWVLQTGNNPGLKAWDGSALELRGLYPLVLRRPKELGRHQAGGGG